MFSVLLWLIEQVLDKLTSLSDRYWFVSLCGSLIESGVKQLPMESPLIAVGKKARVEVHTKPMRACQLISLSHFNGRRR